MGIIWKQEDNWVIGVEVDKEMVTSDIVDKFGTEVEWLCDVSVDNNAGRFCVGTSWRGCNLLHVRTGSSRR